MKLLILIFILISGSVCFTQVKNSSEYFNLSQLKIKQFEGSEIVTYGFNKERNLFILNDSTLTADTIKYKYTVPLKNIITLTISTKSNAGYIAGGAGLAGFFLGFMGAGFSIGDTHDISFLSRLGTGFVVGGVFAILGGTVSLLFHSDDVLDLSGNYYDSKHTRLSRFLMEHQIK